EGLAPATLGEAAMPALVATTTRPPGVPDSDIASPALGAYPAGTQERPPFPEYTRYLPCGRPGACATHISTSPVPVVASIESLGTPLACAGPGSPQPADPPPFTVTRCQPVAL